MADGATSGASGLEDFERAVTWLGFAPRRKGPSGVADETVSYELTNCPYRQAVEANQPVVCTLHKGILSGLLETLEPEAEITGFRPRGPSTAGCTVALMLCRRNARARARDSAPGGRPTDDAA